MQVSCVGLNVGLGICIVGMTGRRIGRLLQFRRQPDVRRVVTDLEAVGAETGRTAIQRIGDRQTIPDVDRRLAVLGTDDDQRRIVEILSFEFVDELAERIVYELKLQRERIAWGRLGIGIATDE